MDAKAIVSGSSPLTRGALHPTGPNRHQQGLIPAHAGSTPRWGGQGVRTGAHPRSRGEHRRHPRHPNPGLGSSPLTRGAHLAAHLGLVFGGLIPAHAGSTSPSTGHHQTQRAHPRSRGEHHVPDQVPRSAAGSSPLTRGALEPGLDGIEAGRLIPAHAGSTAREHQRGGDRRAHPRSRGEHVVVVLGVLRDLGSSPLTRGALGGFETQRLRNRLIPAHAGSTPQRWRRGRAHRAHPRSREEHDLPPGKAILREGSSPLTRGAHPPVMGGAPVPGLIPAHAGSTLLKSCK